MNIIVLGALLIIVPILCITPFIIPTHLDYYRIYKMVQEPYGLSDFQIFWWSLRDAFSDVFNIDPVDDDEADE